MSGLDLSYGGIGFRGGGISGGGGGGVVVGPLLQDYGNDRGSGTNSPSSSCFGGNGFGSGSGGGCFGGYASSFGTTNTATTTTDNNNDGCFWSFTTTSSIPPPPTSLHRDDTTTTTIISDNSSGNSNSTNNNNIGFSNVATDTNNNINLSSWSQFQLRKLWGSGNGSRHQNGGNNNNFFHHHHHENVVNVIEDADNKLVVVTGDGDGDHNNNKKKTTNANTNANIIRPISVTDDDLAIALNSLSFQQREIVYNDIHGINESYKKEEDPTMINTCLQEMKQRLLEQVVKFGARDETSSSTAAALPSLSSSSSSTTSTSNSSTTSFALKEAIEQNSNYVMNKKFLLSFLRADEYNVELACNRMINFFQYKKELFGTSSLTQDITLAQHFNDDDMHCLVSGGFQYVPLQDRSGRHITVNIPALESIQVHENLVRYFFEIFGKFWFCLARAVFFLGGLTTTK